MDEHGKKMLAPIIITVLVTAYVLGGFIACILWDLPRWIAVCCLVIGLVVIAVMVGVLISRIKEIRSGEEDDLSKY